MAKFKVMFEVMEWTRKTVVVEAECRVDAADEAEKILNSSSEKWVTTHTDEPRIVGIEETS